MQIDGCLRSVSHPRVFAVGDCAHWHQPLPKAGVYAVRMGPVLLDNLLASLQGTALRAYAPQTRFLSLLATASSAPVGSAGALASTLKGVPSLVVLLPAASVTLMLGV